METPTSFRQRTTIRIKRKINVCCLPVQPSCCLGPEAPSGQSRGAVGTSVLRAGVGIEAVAGTMLGSYARVSQARFGSVRRIFTVSSNGVERSGMRSPDSSCVVQNNLSEMLCVASISFNNQSISYPNDKAIKIVLKTLHSREKVSS